MDDPRIPKYRAAVAAMASGRFRIDLSVEPDDDLGSLGRELELLGQTLDRRFAEMTTLRGLTERVNAGLLVEDMLDHVFESFGSVIPYDRIGFSFIQDQGRTVKAIWARSVAPDLKISVGYSAPLAGSSLQQIVESGRPRIINDLAAYLREHPQSQSTRLIVEEGHRSSLTCPLVAAGKPVGFLFFSSRQPNTYVDAHVDVYMQVAGHLSLIVEKGRLYQDLAETKRQLEEANRALQDMANLDGLTGIPNRRALDERLILGWRRAMRHGTPLALLMIDIDFFKRFNDQHGHLEGDRCLRRVAGALQAALRRPDDFVGRYGGEEFLVVAETTDLAGGAHLGELLRARVEALGPPPHADSVAPLTISVGVASTVPARDATLADLVSAADRALYRAKENGRNRVEGLRIDAAQP